MPPPSKPTYQLFSAALTEALQDHSMTNSALADKANVNRSRLSEFTQGASLPKDDTIVAICAVFRAASAQRLAKAWVQERLGPELSAAILASDSIKGTRLEQVFSALPTTTQKSFLALMDEARVDEDLRGVAERLASYVSGPEVKTISYTPGAIPETSRQQRVAEEHGKGDEFEGQH